MHSLMVKHLLGLLILDGFDRLKGYRCNRSIYNNALILCPRDADRVDQVCVDSMRLVTYIP